MMLEIFGFSESYLRLITAVVEATLPCSFFILYERELGNESPLSFVQLNSSFAIHFCSPVLGSVVLEETCVINVESPL